MCLQSRLRKCQLTASINWSVKYLKSFRSFSRLVKDCFIFQNKRKNERKPTHVRENNKFAVNSSISFFQRYKESILFCVTFNLLFSKAEKIKNREFSWIFFLLFFFKVLFFRIFFIFWWFFILKTRKIIWSKIFSQKRSKNRGGLAKLARRKKQLGYPQGGGTHNIPIYKNIHMSNLLI